MHFNRKSFIAPRLFVASLALLLLAGSLYAQEPRRFLNKGSVELGGSIAFNTVQPVVNGKNGNAVNVFAASPYVGYFVIDGLEIGVNPLGIAVRDSSGANTTDLRIFLAPSYNFRTSSLATPFIEGLAGFTFRRAGNVNSNGFSWGGRAGIKAALTDKGLLNIGVQFVAITLNTGSQTSRNGTNEFSIVAGWTVWI